MRIVFDPNKNRLNLAKHGLSLALAADVEWDDALVWVDERMDYGEPRLVALVPMSGTLYCVAFVDRDHTRRIISLRRANRREVKHYVQAA